jgi:predicted dehydrogenase
VTADRPALHGDYDDALLGRDDIDVIDICLPPFLHGPAVTRALRAGRHVICEKPLVGSLAEVDALEAVVRETGRVLMPVFQARFGNGLARAKHLFDTGATGRVFHVTAQTHWSRGADYYAVKWRGTRASELGGAFLGHAIHIHDMLTTLVGPVRRVSAMTTIRVNPIETEDCGGAILEMADGSIAVLSVTLGSADEISRLRIMCENVTIESHGEVYASSKEPWQFLPKAPKDQAWLDAALAGAESGKEGFARQFEAFHAALATGAPPPVTVAEARASLELVTAIYHSARTGERVDLPLPPTHAAYRGW